jgi:hypothetical protein
MLAMMLDCGYSLVISLANLKKPVKLMVIGSIIESILSKLDLRHFGLSCCLGTTVPKLND